MKRTIALLIVLCTLLSLVACGSPSIPADNQAQQSPANNQTQHAHSFGEWTTTKAPTCTEAGEQERFCSCGEKQTQTVAATGHSFGAWVTTKASTCTEAGEQERACACGERQTQAITAGHSFGEWVTVNEATCTEMGKQERICACGEKQTQTINTIGHKWEAATCTEPKKCSNCGTTTGSALGHKYQNGTCTRCNEKVDATLIMPTAGGVYSGYSLSSGKKLYTCKITEIETPVIQSVSSEGVWFSVKVTYESLYENAGNDYARRPYVNYEIYDENNALVKRGHIFGEAIKVGETCTKKANIYYLEPGHTYTVKLLDYIA